MDKGHSLPRNVSLLMAGSLQGETEHKALWVSKNLLFNETILEEVEAAI